MSRHYLRYSSSSRTSTGRSVIFSRVWRVFTCPGVLVGLLMCLFAFACHSEPEPEPSYVSKYVSVIFYGEEEIVCAGSLDYVDRYIERVFAYLGEQVPVDFNIRVHVVGASTYFDDDQFAYFDGEAVYMRSLAMDTRRSIGSLRHEVTHAVVGATWGASASFFVEGLVEGLARSIDLDAEIGAESLPVSGELGRDWRDLDYLVAARFSRYLLVRFGVPQFKEVFQGALGRSETELASLLQSVYGHTIEELEAMYLDENLRCTLQLDVCDVTQVKQVSSSLSISFSSDCGSPYAYGAISESASQFSFQQTIMIESDGIYYLRSKAPFTLTRCGACDVQFVRQFDWGVDAVTELLGGIYNVEIAFGQMSYEDAVLEVARVATDIGSP